MLKSYIYIKFLISETENTLVITVKKNKAILNILIEQILHFLKKINNYFVQ